MFNAYYVVRIIGNAILFDHQFDTQSQAIFSITKQTQQQQQQHIDPSVSIVYELFASYE